MSEGTAMRGTGVQRALALTIVGVTGSAVAVTIWLQSRTADVPPAATEKSAARAPVVGRDVVPPLLFQPLTEQEAKAINAANPIVALPNPAAAVFTLAKADALAQQRALDCLTTAIYFEAGFEGEQGRAAVAQVILNRLRHPAFPKSVCEVVFQGSERVTGCQFSFTCDGALLRIPDATIWAESRRSAERALAGHVEKSVGWSTHYHADYVFPYWGPSLVKTAVIGAHIFYRMQPGVGSPANFVGAYAGAEPQEPLMAGFSSEVPLVVDSAAVAQAMTDAIRALPPTVLPTSDMPHPARPGEEGHGGVVTPAAGAETPSATPDAGTAAPQPPAYFPQERRQRRSRLPM